MKKWLIVIIFYQQLIQPNIKYQNQASIKTEFYQSDEYKPSGWYGSISTQFQPTIQRYNHLETIEVKLGTWFNRGYGWYYKNFLLKSKFVSHINSKILIANDDQPITVKYKINHRWYGARVDYFFNLEIDDFGEEMYPNWGTWYSATDVGGVSIKLKFNGYNRIQKAMNELYETINNKDAVIINTPNIIAGNNISNQVRIKQTIYQQIGAEKYQWISNFDFYQGYVNLLFYQNLDSKVSSKLIKYNFKYQLEQKYNDFNSLILKHQNQILNIKSHTFSLLENEQTIKSAIFELFKNKKFNNKNITDFIEKYHFKPASLNNGEDSVEVYFKIELLNNFHFQKYWDEQYENKITFKINYLLDENYFQKDMSNRISFETQGKKLSELYNDYEVYSDEVVVKFRTNLEESEILYINNQEVGVSNGLFVYLLKDGRISNSKDKKDEELNVYEIKLVKKDALDPNDTFKDITWIKKIMIRKKAPKLNINLWAPNDEQNPNEIVGMVIYNPLIDDKFKIESKWLKDNEKELLAGVNGLSGSLMGVHNPNWDKKDNLIDEDSITWEYAPFKFEKNNNFKLDINLKANQITEQGLLKDRIKNQSQFFSNTGIFRFKIADKLNTSATYYHINLGINNFINLDQTTGEQILENIKANLYYFWDAKLGKALINYLRGISFYVHQETKKSLSWNEYKQLNKVEQHLYKKVLVGGIAYYSAEELLLMPLHTVHFNISRMIRDLQYDIDGKLEEKLKEDNGGKEELVKEDNIDKGKEDDKEIDDKIDDQKITDDKNKEEKIKWEREKDIIKIHDQNLEKQYISIIIAVSLIVILFLLTLGIIIYFRRKKKIT